MARRIYTIAGRAGTVVVTDSKINTETGKGSMYQYTAEDGNTQLCALKALNETLSIIPRPNKVRMDQPIVFLLPRFLEFLRYEDTRKVWITTGCKKTGEVIEPELLEQVSILDNHVKELDVNIQLFGQRRLTSEQFKAYRDATWKIIDTIVAPPERVDAHDAY